MIQLGLKLTGCAACHAGRRHDETHDHGCPERWLTVGQSFDELGAAEQASHFELMRRHGATKAETIGDYSAGLYRPRRAETIAPGQLKTDPGAGKQRVRKA